MIENYRIQTQQNGPGIFPDTKSLKVSTTSSPTTVESSVAPGWEPVTSEVAGTIWEQLESRLAASGVAANSQSWIVGRHGSEYVGFKLGKEEPPTFLSLTDREIGKIALPRIPAYVRQDCLLKGLHRAYHNDILLQSYEQKRTTLGGFFRSFFLHHATKPLPCATISEQYDSSRPKLSLLQAIDIARSAFDLAVAVEKPVDLSAFGDRWASQALAFVMGEEVDTANVAVHGMVRLEAMRTCNVHRTSEDIVRMSGLIESGLECEQSFIKNITRSARVAALPWVEASRQSAEAFAQACAQAWGGNAKNHRPYSQKLIKGVVLSLVSEARLELGTLSDIFTGELASSYGSAFAHMQDCDVVLWGRPTDAFAMYPYGGFHIFDNSQDVLPHPEIHLCTRALSVDPRCIHHETQHARQHMACEGSWTNLFHPVREMNPSERAAKQAEADMLKRFGVLY